MNSSGIPKLLESHDKNMTEIDLEKILNPPSIEEEAVISTEKILTSQNLSEG